MCKTDESEDHDGEEKPRDPKSLFMVMRKSRLAKRRPFSSERIVRIIKKRGDSRCARCPMVGLWLMDTGCGSDMLSAKRVQNMAG